MASSWRRKKSHAHTHLLTHTCAQAEKSLKGMKEEMAHLKAQRSKTPSDTENSFVGESRASSHRRRQSSSLQDDKVDRTDKSERSERRRFMHAFIIACK